MPSSVTDVFAAAGLAPEGVVPWGAPMPISEPGVYVVALTADATSVAQISELPLDEEALATLLARPELRVDGEPATHDALAARFAACWLPDEVVVYIGLSSRPLRQRVREYYVTRLGTSRPHAGGWFVKTLAAPLSVHYAAAPAFEAAERKMLDAFAAATSAASRARLHDSARPIPYANLRWLGHRRKQHGIDGARD